MDLVMNPYHYIGKLLLMALLVSESYSEHTSELNGYEGQEFIFTCPEGHEPIFWYKGNGTGGERIGRAYRPLNVQECSLPGCTIQLWSGDLTIPSISLDDEGWYTCKRPGNKDDFDDGLHYVKVNVNVHATKETVDMTEIKFPVEGQPFDIECTVDRIKPEPEISFKLHGYEENHDPDEVIIEQLPGGALKISARIGKTFQRSDDGNKFRCIVQPPVNRGNKFVKDRRVYVDWEYSTSVRELDPNEMPVIGNQKTLECVVEDGGKPLAEIVRWLLDGQPIRGSAKYPGLSSIRLTIKDLLKTDIGEYRCSINNRAGPGLSVGGYDLKVWYPYRSVVTGAYFDEIPLIGTSKTLSCNPTERGYPIDVLGVNWYRGGEMISEDEKYERITTYELKVNNLDKYADNGDYTCTIVNAAGEGHSSGRYQLETLWPPAGKPVVEPAKVMRVNGTNLELKCEGSYNHGNPDIYYSIWTKEGDKIFHRKIDGTIMILEDLHASRDSGNYLCQVGNLYGRTNISDANEVKVEVLTSKTLIWNDENFELSCNTKSNETKFTWEKDGQPLDKRFFEYLPLQYLKDNNQTEVYKSTIKRNITDYHFTCKNVEYFNGKYTCHSQSNTFGIPTMPESKSIFVTTQYEALWSGSDKLIHAEVGDTKVSIHCSVCSNPVVTSFEWKFDGSSLRDGIWNNGDTITIDSIQESDYGHYTCTAKTMIDHIPRSSIFFIKLERKGHPSTPTNLRILDISSHSVNLTWTPGYDGGYGPLKFKLEYWALNGFKKFKVNISESHFFLNKLKPGTKYDLRIQAINQRPVDKGHNYSYMVPTTFTTRTVPNITHKAVAIKRTNMTISWNFFKSAQREFSSGDDYTVEVQVQYKQIGDTEYSIFPRNGSLLDANVEAVVIPGDFDTNAVYLARLLVFENGILDTSNPKTFRTIKDIDSMIPLWITLSILATLLTLTIIVVSAYFVRRRHIHQRVKPKLAPSRHELDNLNPPTPHGSDEISVSGGIQVIPEGTPNRLIPADVPETNPLIGPPIANSLDEAARAGGYEEPTIPVDIAIYTAVSEIRPVIPTVMNDISDYVRAQVEPSLLADPDDLSMDSNPIGEGQYGEVFKGTINDVTVAVKKAKNLGNRQEVNDFFKEAAIMRKVHHKNVLSLLCIVIKDNIPHVVTHFAENGDLKNFISRHYNVFTTRDRLGFSLDIARGMECLAGNQIVHRDLACRNCLVNKDNKVLVTDFGLARDVHQAGAYQSKNTRKLPLRWMAIETLTSRNSLRFFTTKSDVWSYGVTLWEIFTNGELPYRGILDLIQYLKEGNRLQTPSNAPPEVAQLMHHCWRERPHERPTFSDIVTVLDDLIQGMRNEASGGT